MKLFLIVLVYFFVSAKGQRIAGGADVDISEYPHAASLVSNGGVTTAPFTHACGGTILTARAILSAATCFSSGGIINVPGWWRVRVGSSSANSGGTMFFLNRISISAGFVEATRVHDVAVLRTTIPMTLTPGRVETARIAGAAYTYPTHQPLVAIGWGAPSEHTPAPTDQLRRVQVWTIDRVTCTNRYNALGFDVHENMLCAGWLDVGIRGQCPGDAGSPLIDADGAVVAVFSWAEGCANSWYPDINTIIAPYSNWIVSTALDV